MWFLEACLSGLMANSITNVNLITNNHSQIRHQEAGLTQIYADIHVNVHRCEIRYSGRLGEADH